MLRSFKNHSAGKGRKFWQILYFCGMKNRGFIVHLAGVIAMVFWGMSFVWSTQVYQSLNPTATIFLRLVIATVFLTTILFVFRLNEKIQKKHLGLFAIAAMFEPFLYFIFEGYGLKNSSPVIGAGIIALIPLVTPIAARIFLKERLTPMNIVGFIISFAGVIVMLLNKNLELTASPKGILFLCGSVIVAVGYSIALIRLTKLYKPLTITWMQNIVGRFGESYGMQWREFYRGTPLNESILESLRQRSHAVSELKDAPEWASAMGLDRYYSGRMTIGAGGAKAIRSTAKRWVVVDENVYSSSEKFVLFCKQTGWATVVGRHTGGDGLGSSPVLVMLPDSGILIRFSNTAGETLEGALSVDGTEPDILLETGPLSEALLELIRSNNGTN